uniref:Uncharacterized protein n=1 Tax=Timema douglasi TaxID=61478 RepID=A0A7R8VXF0_TIMDO|nr:unnamed protein product [Timema douglasi]
MYKAYQCSLPRRSPRPIFSSTCNYYTGACLHCDPGLALNVKYGRAADLPSSALLQLVSVLTQTLGVDHRAALNRLTSELPLEESSSKEASQVDLALARAERLLDAQRTALEILANLCSGEGTVALATLEMLCEEAECCVAVANTDDDAMDQDSSGNSDDFLSDPEDPEESAPLPAAHFALAVVNEVREGIISHQLVSKVWDRTVYPAENVCQILDSHTRGALVCKKPSRNLQVRGRVSLFLGWSWLPHSLVPDPDDPSGPPVASVSVFSDQSCLMFLSVLKFSVSLVAEINNG